MKTKVTLTIDEDLLPKAKLFARSQGVSLSQLIEITLRNFDVDQQQSFSSRWRGKFHAVKGDDTRFKALEENRNGSNQPS